MITLYIYMNDISVFIQYLQKFEPYLYSCSLTMNGTYFVISLTVHH